MQPFRLAHLSDPHLAPLPPATAGQLASKRITGFLSWQVGRRHIHVRRALDAICADVKRGAFDHIAVTGDVANIALPAEFDHGAEFLASLGTPQNVTVIPGNHDTYVVVDRRDGLGKWVPYMQGDDGQGDAFPFLRRRGPVAIVALNTGVPEAWFFATGELGVQQITRTEEMLAALGREGLFRLVLIHHPPQAGGARWRKRLTDAPAFQAMIGRVGAELVVHGHNHRPMMGRIAGPAGEVPVLGVSSASADFNSHYGPGGYHALAISRAGSDWQLDVEIRQLTGDYAGCRATSALRFFLPAVV
jgi:3',5'-cyclic AMP phosphodiesterase CpdA